MCVLQVLVLTLSFMLKLSTFCTFIFLVLNDDTLWPRNQNGCSFLVRGINDYMLFYVFWLTYCADLYSSGSTFVLIET